MVREEKEISDLPKQRRIIFSVWFRLDTETTDTSKNSLILAKETGEESIPALDSVCCVGQGQHAARGNGEGSHTVAQKAPSWSCPLRNGDAQGKKCKKGDLESLKGGAKARQEKGSTQRRGKVCVCVCARSLLCHKLFKGYMLLTTRLGLRVKVEEFFLLLNPLEHVLLILLLFFLSIRPHIVRMTKACKQNV